MPAVTDAPDWLAPEDRALWDALGDAKPRYTPWPTPGAAHDLRQVEIVSDALGTPLMPWQRWEARIVTEYSSPGEYRFKLVVLTVPRQSGKTTIMRCVLTQRGLRMPRRKAFYTAQTGKDASARWLDLVKAIDAGPFKGKVHTRLAIGSQALTLPNGSTIAPFAPTPKSLHGYTPHDVMCDEIFAFDEMAGSDLMGAIGPAQVTLRSRQLWLVSTMGDRDSTFLHGWVDKGRELTADDFAYFEWSMAPDADPDDPESWKFHPALGHTITMDSLKELHGQHSRGEWLRAFMNVRTVTSESVIAPEVIRAATRPQTPPKSPRDLALAFEVAHDRSRACVWAAWIEPGTGTPAVKLVHQQAGTAWIPGMIRHLYDTMHPKFIGADRGGAGTRDMLDAIANDAPWLEIQIMQATDFATACDAFKARMEEGALSIDASPGLHDSLAAAVQKTMGQGWTWDRVKSRGQIPDLIAATVALRLIERAPAPAPAPLVYVP